MSDPQVSVTLSPLDASLEFPRTFKLSRETQVIPIGRSSKRGPHVRTPAKDNGWFDSRVMSRDHADLVLCLEKNIIYLRDCSSTHGTWLNNHRLAVGEPTHLVDGDMLRFGIDVERDEDRYPAVCASCKIIWTDKYEPQHHRLCNIADTWPRSRPTQGTPQNPVPEVQIISESKAQHEHPATSTNTFSTPGYGDVVEIKSLVPTPPAELSTITIDDYDYEPVNRLSSIPQYVEAPVNETKEVTFPEIWKEDTPNSPRIINLDHPEDLITWTDENDSEQVESEEDEEDEEDASQSESESSDHSDLDSSGESSIGCTDGEIRFDYDSDSDAYGSSCDLDSDAESVSHRATASNIDSDEPLVNLADRYIDPCLLAEYEGVATTTIGKSDVGPDLNAQVKEQVKNETISQPNMSPLADRRSRSPKGNVPRVSNPSPDPSAYPTSLGAYQNALFQDPPLVRYPDGPFTCKEHLREEVGISEAEHGKAEIKHKDEGAKEADVQESGTEEIEPAVETSLKRKAVELEDSQSSQVFESVNHHPQKASVESSSLQPAEATSSALSEIEPPRKRVKPNHSSTSKLASYTATAVISALLGGLGTIALLASLPPEFFQ
ncbi:hypothetical protein N7492_008784 [Penicillium capsulatum]|uniref:FHA domain-containing protein n=1 Tax=Penicillium capsulatum TaxID=69766 RepID=A0A9W9LG87_9EURO|nr:hypothetical protein N7492_008784 [Penicillium capsulatum]KAJ6106185.1 hypothetical protein N7512_009702 [Penicillium capsulatum]